MHKTRVYLVHRAIVCQLPCACQPRTCLCAAPHHCLLSVCGAVASRQQCPPDGGVGAVVSRRCRRNIKAAVTAAARDLPRVPAKPQHVVHSQRIGGCKIAANIVIVKNPCAAYLLVSSHCFTLVGDPSAVGRLLLRFRTHLTRCLRLYSRAQSWRGSLVLSAIFPSSLLRGRPTTNEPRLPMAGGYRRSSCHWRASTLTDCFLSRL